MSDDAPQEPLIINPIHAEYYCIAFQEWRGAVAAVYSGKPENAARRSEIELVVGHPIELVPLSADRIAELHRKEFGIGASSVVPVQGLPDQSSAGRPRGDGQPRSDGRLRGDGRPAMAGPSQRTPPLAKEVHAGATPAARASVEPSIIRFVDRLIHEAFRDRATDIHIEPFAERVDIRYRVDGILHYMPVPSEVKELHSTIVSRLKILSSLDIAEQRLPQDGRFRHTLADGEELDIRVSILPTGFGEAVDLRLLTTRQVYTGLGSLGLSPEDQQTTAVILQRPHGIVLVTGPTGSGKTTTLYAFLAMLNESERKIITIEDPIEYQIPGITQIQVSPKIDLTFARGLRSMLRHDPDVMMVGEIRDYETADTAIQVALTGHLVFSTLHTNDAPSTPARLINMGVEPYLVASSLECVIAQRLVRLVCEHCRHTVSGGLDPVFTEAAENIRTRGIPWDGAFSSGRGCEQCMGTGYRGRTAIYEILPISEALQTAILRQAPASELRRIAGDGGFQPMRIDGLKKVAAHVTTYEEVLRVTRKEVY